MKNREISFSAHFSFLLFMELGFFRAQYFVNHDFISPDELFFFGVILLACAFSIIFSPSK